MHIHAAFDGGNIEVLDILDQSARLAIKADTKAHYRQWFYFCVTAPSLQAQHLTLVNVDTCSYPLGWQHYQAVASHDRMHWFRVPTDYDGKNLSIHYSPTQAITFYAYFEPYSQERYLDFIAKTQNLCQVDVVATSCEGRPLHLLTIGTAEPFKRKLWFIARQHAGEIMASWFIEGLVAKLLDRLDPVSQQLLAEAVIYIVPHMNPDGAVQGHLRANAQGIDLNRQWLAPNSQLAPEVFHVRQKMLDTGVDFFLDIHGDEVIPQVFLAYESQTPSFSDRQGRLSEAFSKALLAASVDFQTEQGYEKGHFSSESLTLAGNYIADAFDCVALTLEMPFKDNANRPDLKEGWSATRSALLAASVVTALGPLVSQLR